ncbi:hypothetical protein AURDEDRAFT_161771 [Auricularia subglabra TFB-10046 SS5]|nr:hypothetical protein AURDEDRAFT_161771 [Auricularia subglabra TFB-10046 SS5]
MSLASSAPVEELYTTTLTELGSGVRRHWWNNRNLPQFRRSRSRKIHRTCPLPPPAQLCLYVSVLAPRFAPSPVFI